jgi:8-oxo-dGTP pyrophosphatase MutT (NUDIX family)
VHHTYVDNWYLIGGGIEPGETAINAVKRELLEEVGVTPMSPPKLFGIYHNTKFKPDDHVALYVIEEFIKEKSDDPEIEAIKWFPMDKLPQNISPAAKRRIEEYLGRREIAAEW